MKIQNLIIMAVFTTLLTNPFYGVSPAMPAMHTGVAERVAQKKADPPAEERTPAESKAEDFVIDKNGRLTKYQGTASIIRIPDGVKEISSSVFAASSIQPTEILELYLPPSVKKIDRLAFWDMAVKKITGGEGLKEIGFMVFERCTLGELSFPNVETINTSAFSYATVGKLDLPALKTIGSYAFEGCNLSELHLPEGTDTIWTGAFAKSTIREITGTGVKEIQKHAFYKSSLESFYFPNVEIIGEEAFFLCPLKDSPEFERLKTLAPQGFEGTESKKENFVIQNGVLTKYAGNASIVKIPDGVTEIAPDMYWQPMRDITEIYLPDSIQKISAGAFPVYFEGKITGGNGVKEICRRAFSLIHAEIPDFPNVEKIEAEAFYLSSVKNEDALKRFHEFAPEAFEPVVSKDEDFIIEKGVLKEYKGDASIVNVPEGVTAIGANAFRIPPATISPYIDQPNYLCEVNLPQSVKKIGSRAFQYSYGLKKITGAKNVTEIGKRAFYDSGIEEIDLTSVKKIGNKAFYRASIQKLDLPNVEFIGEYAFALCELTELSGLKKVKEMPYTSFFPETLSDDSRSQYHVAQKLPNGKENIFLIANNILFDTEGRCQGDVVIPNGVTTVEARFSGDFTSVTIPDSVVKIRDAAFHGNYDLRWVKMEDSVEEIGQDTFAYCKNLAEVRLSDSIRELDGCFQHCPQLTSITLPAAIQKISKDALPEGITSIICPPGMTNIDFRAANGPEGSFIDSLANRHGTFYVPEADENSLLAGYAKEIGWDYRPIELEATELTIKVGQKYPLRFQGNAKAKWETSNKKIATVGSTGDIYAKKTGKVTITATIYGKKYKCKVTVVASDSKIPTSTPPGKTDTTPTPTPILPILAEGEIPLTPEYFPDEAFRELLSALIDVDKNGILTLEEREQLTELRNTCYDMENRETEEYYYVHTPWNEKEEIMYFWLNRVTSLEGIEYFPKLRLLVVDEGWEREDFYDIEGEMKYLESFHAENMPELESVQLMTKTKSVTIKNAPKLRYLYLLPDESVGTCKVTLKDCDSIEKFEYYTGATPIFDCEVENLQYFMLSVWEDAFKNQSVNAFDFPGPKELYLRVKNASKEITIQNFPQLETLSVSCESPVILSGLQALENLTLISARDVQINDCDNIKNISLINMNDVECLDFSMLKKLETVDCKNSLVDHFRLSCTDTNVNVSGADIYIDYCDNAQFFAPRTIPTSNKKVATGGEPGIFTQKRRGR